MGELKDVHTHLAAKELQELLGEELAQYKVVGFIRDPCSLIASKYFFYKQGRARHLVDQGKAKTKNVARVWMAGILPFWLWALIYPFKDNSFYLLGKNGQILVDYLGRFEQLDKNFVEIFVQLGYPKSSLKLAKKNVTRYARNRADAWWLRAFARIRCRRDYLLIRAAEGRAAKSLETLSR